MTNITISPSLLSADFNHLGKEIKKLNELHENHPDLWLHLDIMDGHFVPNLTFGSSIIKSIHQDCKFKLDAHFMVTNPRDYLEWFKDYKLHNFTFHFEAEKNPREFIDKIKDIFPSAGISIKPNTELSSISDEVFKSLDLLLIMSVEPGFGGQGFIEKSLNKIKEANLRKEKINKNLIIQVDGGINNRTSKAVISAGATNLVSGSYFFKHDQYKEAFNSLLKD